MPCDLPVCIQATQAGRALQGRLLRQQGEAMILETPEDLAEYVRHRLPLRARMIGRKRIEDIVSTTIYEWPALSLSIAGGPEHTDAVFDALESQVLASYQNRYGDDDRYGFAIMTIILVAAITAIVQVLVKWWLEKKLHQDQMKSWHALARLGVENRSGDE